MQNLLQTIMRKFHLSLQLFIGVITTPQSISAARNIRLLIFKFRYYFKNHYLFPNNYCWIRERARTTFTFDKITNFQNQRLKTSKALLTISSIHSQKHKYQRDEPFLWAYLATKAPTIRYHNWGRLKSTHQRHKRKNPSATSKSYHTSPEDLPLMFSWISLK